MSDKLTTDKLAQPTIDERTATDPIQTTPDEPAIARPVDFFADDWNKYSHGNSVEFFPVYTGKLHTVELRFNRSRYYCDVNAYYKFMGEVVKPLPSSCIISSTKEEFSMGIISVKVNPLTAYFSEEAVVEFLSWLAITFLPTIHR